MVTPIRDQENITFSTSAITTLNAIMNLPGLVEIDIDNFNIGNIDNYDDIRKHTISSNKTASRMISMSSSKVLVLWQPLITMTNDNTNE